MFWRWLEYVQGFNGLLARERSWSDVKKAGFCLLDDGCGTQVSLINEILVALRLLSTI